MDYLFNLFHSVRQRTHQFSFVDEQPIKRHLEYPDYILNWELRP